MWCGAFLVRAGRFARQSFICESEEQGRVSPSAGRDERPRSHTRPKRPKNICKKTCNISRKNYWIPAYAGMTKRVDIIFFLTKSAENL